MLAVHKFPAWDELAIEVKKTLTDKPEISSGMRIYDAVVQKRED